MNNETFLARNQMSNRTFPNMVENELKNARGRFEEIHNYHEGYAVLLEELDEFWDEVKRWPKKHNTEIMLKELIQIGAMAQRVAEDTKLITCMGDRSYTCPSYCCEETPCEGCKAEDK